MTDPRVPAAYNNAVWCNAVCRAHGHATSLGPDLWINLSPAPPFYSNAVTTSPAFTAAQLSGIRALFDARLPARWSVKDSFCALDLAPLDFEILFEAEWLRLPPDAPLPAPADLWEPITTEGELDAWEAAWRGDAANTAARTAPHIFRPSLLGDAAIVFLALHADDRIVGVAVANRSDDGREPVCGISNLFFPDPSAEHHRAGALAAARAAFPGLPLVGYERGPDLAAVQALGFESLGPLRVWIKCAPGA
jgi:hypothetical protein